MLKSKVEKLEKKIVKEKSEDNDIYNRDVIIIKTWKDFMDVYPNEVGPDTKRVKPTAKIFMTKEIRNFIDHYYDDDDEEIEKLN